MIAMYVITSERRTCGVAGFERAAKSWFARSHAASCPDQAHHLEAWTTGTDRPEWTRCLDHEPATEGGQNESLRDDHPATDGDVQVGARHWVSATRAAVHDDGTAMRMSLAMLHPGVSIPAALSAVACVAGFALERDGTQVTPDAIYDYLGQVADDMVKGEPE